LIIKLAEYCTDNGYEAVIATPTGNLATSYRRCLQHVKIDTVHSLFGIDSSDVTQSQVNWGLCRYDVFFIDEITQVSCDIIDHIMVTKHSLPSHPLIVLVGDEMQLQPLHTKNQRTTVGRSIFF